MPLEDFIGAAENITFQTSGTVEYGSGRYVLYITEKKILLFARTGLIPRDNAITIRFEDIVDMKYSEKGLIKKGVLRIDTESKTGRTMTHAFSGAPGDIIGAWQALQQFIA
ncbi:MAG: hypothetical protein PHS47_03610 [Methanocellales archaeon]|nr:hypothetical protein [Methanocellales archaeon]MDD5446607.1 hypothetical protein [Methanocellales archaeon]